MWDNKRRSPSICSPQVTGPSVSWGEDFRMSSGLGFVMLVTLITWAGIFGYLLFMDRSLRRVEAAKREKEQDDL